MSNVRGLGAATELTSKDSRFAMNAAWVACILGLTGIILFFAYSSRAERTITGKITFGVSITTGQRGTKTGRVSNNSHQDGSPPNPETSHSAGAESIATTEMDTSDARCNPSLNQGLVQASAQVPTSNEPPNGSHNDAPGTSDKIPQSQHLTNQGASHTNSSATHASGTDANTAPSQGLGTSHTRGPQPPSSGTGTVGTNRRSTLRTYILREVGADPRLH
ncbi:MAG: hypothetical protein Q9204_005247 [Flavoplaca sp. TL-2023a]